MNLELERAAFIKKYAAALAALAPEDLAKLVWNVAKEEWSKGFAEARVIIEKRDRLSDKFKDGNG